MDATLYEARHSFVWNLGAELIPLLAPKPGERILDLGCGTGHLTAKIAEVGASIVGLDSSPDMIGQARQNYPGLDFRLADATQFAFETPFDAVFSNAALHWMVNARAVAQNVAACLRPGGRFVAEFGGKRNVRTFLSAAASVLGAHGFQPGQPWFFPSVGEYARILEDSGFEVRAAWHFDRPTSLDEGEDSMLDWINMFGIAVLSGVPKARRQEIDREIEALLRPKLYRDGRWHMDYVRIRVEAIKLPDPLNSTPH